MSYFTVKPSLVLLAEKLKQSQEEVDEVEVKLKCTV